MLKDKLVEIIDNKVNNFVLEINGAIFQEIKSNPELYFEKNYIIKIPVNKVIDVGLDEQEIWNGNDGFGNEWEMQFFDDYEKDFEVSELWEEIGKKIEEYYANNGYELKILKQEGVVPYYVEAITGSDPMTYEAEWSIVEEERKKRINYFGINKNGKEINEESPLFHIENTIEDALSSRFKKIIEDIDQIIINEVSQKNSFNSLNLKFRASKIFPIPDLSGIDDVTDLEYTFEEDFSSSIFWLAHRMRIEEYYTSQGFRFLLQFDSEFIYDEENDVKCIGPYNYIQIEKMNITLPTKSNLLFLDTEVHDLKFPILIQLAYKNSDTGESFSEYYSTDGVQISDGAMGVHHITEKMLEGKEVFSKSKDKSILQNILNEKILVAHNAKFDIGVLKSVGMQIPRSICTLKIAHYLYPNLENYKLQTLRYTFKLELEGDINPHDAMSDVLVLEKLFGKFYDALSSKLGTTDTERIFEEMIEISSRPILLDTITFGKHKGGKWSAVPKDYLDWILNKSDFKNDEDIAYTCRYYLGIQDQSIKTNPISTDKIVKDETDLFGNIVAVTFFIGPIPSVIIAFILFPENPRDNWFLIWIGLLTVAVLLWVVFKKKQGNAYHIQKNNNPDDLSENMFAQAWKHNSGVTKGIEDKKDDDYTTDRNNESKSIINTFGVFLILVVIMVLLSVLI